MSRTTAASCKVIRPGDTYDGKQGFSYFEGIAKETVGSEGICMHLLTIPPGGRARAHMHENHETAIYVLSGESHTWFGERLEQHVIVRGGEMFYIPKGVPHLPANLSDQPCTAVIARTDPNEQESVVLLPELDALVPGARPGQEVTGEGYDATTGDLK
jgi:uncharacterized RmlC-like cupin family protein